MNRAILGLLLIAMAATHLAAYRAGSNANAAADFAQAQAYVAAVAEHQAQVDALAAELEAERAKRIPKDRVITKEVVRYAQLPPDRRCDLDTSWRVLHDAAATGEPPEPARLAPGAAEPVGDAAALETVAGNYEQCRKYIDQLDGWQQWWDRVSK